MPANDDSRSSMSSMAGKGSSDVAITTYMSRTARSTTADRAESPTDGAWSSTPRSWRNRRATAWPRIRPSESALDRSSSSFSLTGPPGAAGRPAERVAGSVAGLWCTHHPGGIRPSTVSSPESLVLSDRGQWSRSGVGGVVAPVVDDLAPHDEVLQRVVLRAEQDSQQAWEEHE